MFHSTGVVGMMTLLSRVLGLVRDVFFARLFGAFPIMDAFFVAFKIPNSFRRFFAEGAFARAFIPVLSDYRENQDEADVQGLIDRTSGTLGLILFVITLIGIVAAPVIILIFAPGFFDEQNNGMENRYDLSVAMLRFTFPYLLFISLTAFAGAILNTNKQFWATAFAPVILNIVLIIASGWIAPSASNPGLILAMAVFVAGFLQLLFLLPFVYQIGQLPKPKWGWKDSGVRKITKLMIPSIIGSSAAQVNLLFNTLIASFLTAGSISWIYYSDRLLEFPVGVFGVALSTVVLPNLATKSAVHEEAQFKSIVQWGVRISLLVSVPAATGLYILSGPLIATIFLGGNFNIHDLYMTQYSLMAYAFGLIGLSLVLILASAYYAKQNTKTPVKFGLIAMATNASLSILFVTTLVFTNSPYPHIGLSLAFTFSTLINAALLFRGLNRENQIKIGRDEVSFFIRVIAATAVMAFMLVFYNPDLQVWLDQNLLGRVANLMKLIPSAILVYVVTLFCLGIRASDIRVKTNSEPL
ncbi:MAG: murein biosynthesis integral membrane protein MurJ [Gammaproteobacteria bacterium]|nr:murein biosynthesis integral membrane protein MurJ [Gammaproteobacteria bacterium]